MGGGSSVGPKIEGASAVFEMFSEESFACSELSRGNNKKERDTLWKEWPESGDNHDIWKEYGVSRASPFVMRWTMGGCSAEEIPAGNALNGASMKVTGEPGASCAHVVLVSWSPWEAPCAFAKKAKHSGKTVPVCFRPVVKTVDIYLKIDGEPQLNGIVCNENGTKNLAVENGCAVGAFATLVSDQFCIDGREAHILHLPLLAASGDSAQLFKASANYGTPFAGLFATALAKAGPGAHQIDLRIAPRGCFGSDVLEEGYSCFGFGYTDSGIGINPTVDGFDAGTKELCGRLASTQILSTEHPGLCASFTIEAANAATFASSAELDAPEFNSRFAFGPDVLQDLCGTALKLARGPPSSTATAALGSSAVGAPAHIVVPESDHCPTGIGSSSVTSSDGGPQPKGAFEFAEVIALWKNPDAADDPEATGAMVKFRIEKYSRRNFANVGDPKWEVARTFSATKIKNKAIEAGIARDSDTFTCGI